jgi:hypothetical protein
LPASKNQHNTGSDLLPMIKVAKKKSREAMASSPICG